MAKTKRKILLVNEFSQLSTGYATYFKHILPYLHATGKYEFAEIAVFLSPGHPKKDHWLSTTPWKVYMNEPPADAPAEVHQAYRSDQHNQLGKFRLDEILLDFKCDLLLTMRDPYVDSFIDHTPYRKLFKHVHMPTIDSEPLKQEWIEQYAKADCLLTYSYFGKRVLEQQSGGKLKVAAVASPGADTKEFYPMDKKTLRQQMGIREDSFIVQTVMRNQPRKLFPELFKAFAAFLAKCEAEGNRDLAARSYLHIHSTHPDLGWNLPVEIRNYKLSHKVLWTYMCESCQRHEVSFFRGPETVCPHCTKPTYHLPNTAMGLSRPALAEIMNLPDVYVQYVSAGGWEMPVSDAKSCGVPVLVTDYSATSEQGHTPGGFAIPPATFGQEPYATSTGQIRAVSLDTNILLDKLYEYGTMSSDALREIGLAGRRLMEDVYDWSKIAKIWESVLDEVEIYDRNLTWYSAPQIQSGNVELPSGGTNQEFVKACFERILRANPDANVNEINRLAGLLNQGYEVSSDQHGRTFRAPVNRQSLAQNIAAKVKSRNEAEHRRMMAVFGAAERGNRIEVVTL